MLIKNSFPGFFGKCEAKLVNASARPAKAAAYNEVLYSNPYRRYGILEPPDVPIAGRIPKHRRLSKPLPCKCPVCKNGGSEILGVGKRPFIRARALHNYYHLKRTFAGNSV